MKKVRKTLAFVLCMCMLMAMSVAAFAAEPRAMVTKCSRCGVGKVTTYTSRAYEHDEHFDCVHGYNNGSDVFAVYCVTVRESCDSCSYSYQYKYDDHVLKSCNGF